MIFEETYLWVEAGDTKKAIMSISSDISDENLEVQDGKDEDFKIDDYQKEIDSDDSYSDIPEASNDDNVRLN